MTLQEHIESLALTHGVTVDWRKRTNARAWARDRKVRLPLIRHAGHYAIALHELGHVLGCNSGSRCNKERQAWEWALANAIPGSFDVTAWTTVYKSMWSYIEWAGARQWRKHVRPVVPDQKFMALFYAAKAKAGVR